MKRIVVLLMVLVLFAGIFVACEKIDPQISSTTTTTTTQPDTMVNLNDYVGFWYEYDINNPSEDDIDSEKYSMMQYYEPILYYNELNIKKVEGNLVTLDYSFAMIEGEDVVVEVNGNKGELSKEDYQTDNFYGYKYSFEFVFDDENSSICIKVVEHKGEFEDSVEYVFNFDYQSPTKIPMSIQTDFDGDLNLNDYLGCWFMDEEHSFSSMGNLTELHISEVNGNTITFKYELMQLCLDSDITVEINKNIGCFRGERSIGIIRIEKDRIILTLRSVPYGESRMQQIFTYKTHNTGENCIAERG